jgi:hypothetical protein
MLINVSNEELLTVNDSIPDGAITDPNCKKQPDPNPASDGSSVEVAFE